jgi:hypothetical protein
VDTLFSALSAEELRKEHGRMKKAAQKQFLDSVDILRTILPSQNASDAMRIS